MKSQIIITVEHGETTDPITDFVDSLSRPDSLGLDLTVLDYEVKVNLGLCDSQDGESHEGLHIFRMDCVGWWAQ